MTEEDRPLQGYRVSFEVTLNGKTINLANEFDTETEAREHVALLIAEECAQNIRLEVTE